MKVLVTGGSGFIGSHLIDSLVAKGDNVRCLVRKKSDTSHLKKSRVKLLYGDLNDKESLSQAVNDIEVVYHLAGMLGKWGVSDETYWNVHVHGTQKLVEACIEQDLERFIHCSSAGVLGPLIQPPANETYPYAPSNIYETTKAESEKIVMKYFNENGLPATVIRPEFVYGPRDMHVLGLFKAIQKGKFLIVGNGNSLLHPTYIDDLIQGFELCVKNKKTIGEIYLIAGDRYVTVKDFIGIISESLSVLSPKRHFPVRLAIMGAKVSEFVSKLFGFDPFLTRSRVAFFTENRAFDISKAKKELNYEPVALEEGIKMTVEWYIQNGYLNFKKQDYSVESLYTVALAEGEGFGTAYEYLAKWNRIRKVFDRIGPEKNILINGLPEKYGTSMDFVLFSQGYNHCITVVDEREEAINKLRRSLNFLKTEDYVDRIIKVDKLYKNRNENLKNKFDLLLCCEVLQRLTDEERGLYLKQTNEIAKNTIIFAPNQENNSHAKTSGLKTISLNELEDQCINQKCVVLDKGYVDMPPFPPGLNMSKRKEKKSSESFILNLLAKGLNVWCNLENKFPKILKKRCAHIVYIVLTSA